MHYEDLTLIGIRKNQHDGCWYGKFQSKNGGCFDFKVAEAGVKEDEISLIIGCEYLGAIENDCLVGLSVIKEKKQIK